MPAAGSVLHMRITIIGHGRVAMLAAPMLVRGGHALTAVVASAEQADAVGRAGARAVVADLAGLDADGLRRLVAGSDGVVWLVGEDSGDGVGGDVRAAIGAIDAAAAERVRRFVKVTWAGSDRDEADEHLRRSTLQWTVLAPGRLTDDGITHRIDYGPRLAPRDTSCANVAELVTLTVGRADLVGATISFHDGRIGAYEALNSIARQLAGRPVARAREGHARSAGAALPPHLTGRHANP